MNKRIKKKLWRRCWHKKYRKRGRGLIRFIIPYSNATFEPTESCEVFEQWGEYITKVYNQWRNHE